jgi:hypothetical protein
LLDTFAGITTFTEDQDVIDYFTQGQCNALAWEIHKLTGFSLGLYTDAPVGQIDYSGHAFLYTSDGLILDIRGIQEFDVFKKDWYWLHTVHRFLRSEDYELEMALWENKIHYTRDKYAKKWAKYIVSLL